MNCHIAEKLSRATDKASHKCKKCDEVFSAFVFLGNVSGKTMETRENKDLKMLMLQQNGSRCLQKPKKELELYKHILEAG